MTKLESVLVIIGAVQVIATALAPLFPVGSKPARFLNWIGTQFRGLAPKK
jgi:hypothetical protein